MKFLVIRFSSIGDIVLASPVLRCLKEQIITAEIHFLTKSSFRMVTASNPRIDRFFYYDNDLPALISELKRENYDYIIDLQNNIRSNRITRALAKKTFAVDKLNLQKELLTRFQVDVMPRRHITLRSVDTLRAFGIEYDHKGLEYFIAADDRIRESDIPASHLAGYIAVVIGASYHTKKLPVHKLRELCSLINHPLMLIGGTEDRQVGEQVAAVAPDKIYNACGKFNLNESADLVRRSRLVISHDTGLQYIACAFGKPVIAIWGSTSPALDVEPLYAGNAVATNAAAPYENILTHQPCQPCSKYGNKKCPLGHFRCMEEMNIPFIVERVNRRLGR